MFQHLKLWKEHAPVGACFGVFHPLFKPPAGTSPLFKRRESSVIQPILATLLIINSYGQGNKPDQDTPSHSAPATTEITCTSSPGHALFWNPATLFYTPHLFPAGWMAHTAGQNWGLPKSFPAHFCWRDGTVLGLKDRAEKSSFLPAEGSGTHKPAIKCVKLYCKQEIHAVQTKPRVQNHNSTA